MRIYIFIFSLLFLSACKSREDKKNKAPVKKEGDIIEFARHFELFDYDTLQLIHIKNTESGKIERKYFISESLEYKDYQKLPNFLDKIITLSSTNVGMLSKINMEGIIVGVSDYNYVHNATVKEGIELDKVAELGDEYAISPERILKSKAQIVFFSGFGKKFPNEDKLQKQEVLSIPIYDWKELHPLGKAEWILLFGYICNQKEEALSYFNKVRREYFETLKILRSQPKDVQIMSGNLHSDTWHCPAGNSFMARLFDDAKLKYFYSDNTETGSLLLNPEKAYGDFQEADFWFNPGVSSKNMLLSINPKADLFKAYQNDQIYCYSHNSAKYWELAAIEPHHVLFDYVSICHPGILKEQSTYFFEKLRE